MATNSSFKALSKQQPISKPACFFFDNGRCMFCPGSSAAVRREGEKNKRKLGRFALCAMLFALFGPAHAQQPAKVHRIGYLGSMSSSARLDAFRQGLCELGYVEG